MRINLKEFLARHRADPGIPHASRFTHETMVIEHLRRQAEERNRQHNWERSFRR